MKYYIFIVLSVVLFFKAPGAHAIVNPLESENNIHGVHIVDESDLDDAARLVNSSGGEWGYIAMVIREDERDIGRWQQIFDRMRELKLIPVLRLATHGTDLGWAKPSEDSAHDWVSFFDQLNWVTENRYIVLFNEPNHAHEWEGDIQPAEYARIARMYRDTFKSSSEDYFILPAGFDQAAGDTTESMSITRYFDGMLAEDPSIFTLFDGWTSHAYPNPNFSGAAEDDGRRSIRGFDWEVSYLSAYGLDEQIPIFITETGWAHKEGVSEDSSFRSADDVAEQYERAYTYAWNDERIVMVSPFLLNYQSDPFEHFSWRMPGSGDFYPQYDRVLGLKKAPGNPTQRVQGYVDLTQSITDLIADTLFYVPVRVTNNGQSIWEESQATIDIVSDDLGVTYSRTLPSLKPMESAIIKVPVSIPDTLPEATLTYRVSHAENVLHETSAHITVKRATNSPVKKIKQLWGLAYTIFSPL